MGGLAGVEPTVCAGLWLLGCVGRSPGSCGGKQVHRVRSQSLLTCALSTLLQTPQVCIQFVVFLLPDISVVVSCPETCPRWSCPGTHCALYMLGTLIDLGIASACSIIQSLMFVL